jgi:carbohydrate diacid regulator
LNILTFLYNISIHLGGIQKMLKQELAENIVKEVRILIDEDVIVVGTDGIIIASTDRLRLNSFHEGAFRVSNTKQRLIISKED